MVILMWRRIGHIAVCIEHCRFVALTVFVNLNLVSKVSAHVQAIPSKSHSDHGPEIQCTVLCTYVCLFGETTYKLSLCKHKLITVKTPWLHADKTVVIGD